MSDFMKPVEIAALLGVTEQRIYQIMEQEQLEYQGRSPRRISRDSFKQIPRRSMATIDQLYGRQG